MTQVFQRIGFIGLGVMGEAMCVNLVRRGAWPVMVCDLMREPVDRLVKEGAKAASGAGALARACDLVITCLPGGDQVHDLVLGDERLIDQFQPGAIYVDMSTSQPELMREIALQLHQRGVRFADAPVMRTRQAAMDGTLAILVGGEREVHDAVRPVFETMGSDIFHCGPAGAGQVVKIMNNMVLFQTVAALGEAIALSEPAGVDAATLLDILSKGSGDSFALRNHGLKSLVPEAYPERAFSVRYAAKDLSYALEMARTAGVDAKGAAHVAALFERSIAAGDGDRYFPVIRKLAGKADD